VNEPMLDLDSNEVRITAISNGRFGYLNLQNTTGSGVLYKGVQYNGDAGILVGINANQVSNNVYNTTTNDDHFKPENRISFVDYPGISQHAVHHMNDSGAGNARIGLRIKQSSFEMNSDSLRCSVFLNYLVTNQSGNNLDSISIAQYNDWEVENNNANFCTWIDSFRVGYTRGTAFRRRFAGVQLLTDGEPQFYAIDALNNTNNENINLFDGYSIAEKWKTISKGIGRETAGVQPLGNNVVQVTGVKLRNFEAGETRKVTFAYLFADSISELVQKAKAHKNFFRKLNTSPSPLSRNVFFCEGDTIANSIQGLDGITKFKIHTNQNAIPVFEGTQFNFEVFKDTSLFISGNDSLFEGKKVLWNWQKIEKPEASFAIFPITSADSVLIDSSISFIALDSSQNISNQWVVNGSPYSTLNQITVLFDTIQNYEICLKQTENTNSCTNTSCKTIRVYQTVNVKNQLKDLYFSLFPNPAKSEINIRHSTGKAVFQLMDGLGRIVLIKNLESNNERIQLDQIPKGMYWYNVKSKGGQKFGKLVIE
jgi:hypothetical protein